MELLLRLLRVGPRRHRRPGRPRDGELPTPGRRRGQRRRRRRQPVRRAHGRREGVRHRAGEGGIKGRETGSPLSCWFGCKYVCACAVCWVSCAVGLATTWTCPDLGRRSEAVTVGGWRRSRRRRHCHGRRGGNAVDSSRRPPSSPCQLSVFPPPRRSSVQSEAFFVSFRGVQRVTAVVGAAVHPRAMRARSHEAVGWDARYAHDLLPE